MTFPDNTNDVNSQGQSDNGTGTGAGDNPLYAEYLERFPEDLRPVAQDVFKDWDAKTTQQFQQRAQEYQSLQSEYEPYKPFIDEYEADGIANAIQIAEALQADPRGVYEALAKAHGFGSGDGGQGESTTQPDTQAVNLTNNDPRLDQVMAMQEQMAATLLADQQSKQEAAQEAALDQVLNDLKTKHGDYDERYVMSLLATGMEPEAAISQFKSTVESFASKQNAPLNDAAQIMGSGGGGYPTQQVDTTKMSDQERKAHVVALIQAHQNAV